MWNAWNLSKAYGCRPSQLYFITDEVAAFCFDRAVATFGLAVEEELHDAAEGAKDNNQAKRKQSLVLQRWLKPPEEEQEAQRAPAKFKDPAERLRSV